MINHPITFGQQMYTDYFNLQPSLVKGRANRDTEYQKRYLYMLIYSTLKFNIPDNWPLNWFRFWLFNFGSIGVIYTRKFGWIAQPYSIEEIDLYYQPSKIVIYNQFLEREKTGVIGVNAGIIHICDDYFGLDDLVTDYAETLAQIDKDIKINLMNANVSLVYGADNYKAATDIKKAYGDATVGNPLVVVNKDLINNGKGIAPLFQDISKNYIVDKLLTSKRTVINQFLTRIGIRNANYEKKERLNSMEVEENNDETRAIISLIKENIQECFDRINRISRLGLTVDYRYHYGGDNNGSNDIMGDVSV